MCSTNQSRGQMMASLADSGHERIKGNRPGIDEPRLEMPAALQGAATPMLHISCQSTTLEGGLVEWMRIQSEGGSQRAAQMHAVLREVFIVVRFHLLRTLSTCVMQDCASPSHGTNLTSPDRSGQHLGHEAHKRVFYRPGCRIARRGVAPGWRNMRSSIRLQLTLSALAPTCPLAKP